MQEIYRIIIIVGCLDEVRYADYKAKIILHYNKESSIEIGDFLFRMGNTPSPNPKKLERVIRLANFSWIRVTNDLYTKWTNGGLIICKDEILEEIYRIREEHAKSFNCDLQAICNDLRKKQSTSGRQIISAPLKPRSHPHNNSDAADWAKPLGWDAKIPATADPNH